MPGGYTLREAALIWADKGGGPPACAAAQIGLANVDRFLLRLWWFQYAGLTLWLILASAAVYWAVETTVRTYRVGNAPIEPILLAIVFLGLAMLWRLVWPLLILLEKRGWVPRSLRNPDLSHFHKIRIACAESRLRALLPTGARIPAVVFDSIWALTLFSNDARSRRWPLPFAPRTPDEAFLQAGPETDLIVHGRNESQVDGESGFQATVINALIKADFHGGDVVTNVIMPAPLAATPRKSRSSNRHWFADVDAAHFAVRAPQIAGTWNGPQEQQMLLALQTAFDLTRADRSPNSSIKELVRAVAEAFAKEHFQVGFGVPKEGKGSESDSWLHKLFEAGDSHSVSWVRPTLLDPNYVPKQLRLVLN